MSGAISFDSVNVGDAIPDLVKPAITPLQLALFAGASGDYNPIHVDAEAARAGGLPGVIAHGMLSMAFLGQLLTNWVPQKNIRSLTGRFVAMAFLKDVIKCSGTVTGKSVVDGKKLVELDLAAEN